MRATTLIIAALALALDIYSAGSADARDRAMPVVVPLVAEPAAPEELVEHTVALGEPFLKQRFRAVRSATLRTDVTTPARAGSTTLQIGTRLVFAQGEADAGTIYCAAYNPQGATTRWLVSVYRVEWICFQDADGDLTFERSYLAPSTGALMPSFSQLSSPQEVRATYTVDPQEERYYLETALFYEKYFNIYGLALIQMKVRRQGDEAWTNATSTTRGVTGANEAFHPSKAPVDVNDMGAQARIVSVQNDTLTVLPLGVSTGVIAFRVDTGFR